MLVFCERLKRIKNRKPTFPDAAIVDFWAHLIASQFSIHYSLKCGDSGIVNENISIGVHYCPFFILINMKFAFRCEFHHTHLYEIRTSSWRYFMSKVKPKVKFQENFPLYKIKSLIWENCFNYENFPLKLLSKRFDLNFIADWYEIINQNCGQKA